MKGNETHKEKPHNTPYSENVKTKIYAFELNYDRSDMIIQCVAYNRPQHPIRHEKRSLRSR